VSYLRFVASTLFEFFINCRHLLVQLGISLTNITGTSPPEVCSLRDKKLNFQTTGWAVVDHFESDCRSEDESAPLLHMLHRLLVRKYVLLHISKFVESMLSNKQLR
jgi:hypothetical protein